MRVWDDIKDQLDALVHPFWPVTLAVNTSFTPQYIYPNTRIGRSPAAFEVVCSIIPACFMIV